MIFCLWCCFLIRGLFYCMVLPIWEGFDEYAHYGHVQYIGEGRGWLPAAEARASREVERSIALVPMPWTSRSDLSPHETHDSYWKLSGPSRQEREREVAAIGHSLAAEDASNFVPVESQQPPLNYWLMAAVYRLFRGASLPAQIGILRTLNLLLASIAVPAAWAMAERVFQFARWSAQPAVTEKFATAAAAIVALQPEVLFDSARVANSGLSIAFYSRLRCCALESWIERAEPFFRPASYWGSAF